MNCIFVFGFLIMLLGKIKINTAVLICTAFVFRLLFVNIGLVSSLNTSQNNSTIKRHFSSVIKKRRNQVDPVNNPISFGCSSAEILEESSDDDDQFKLSAFNLLIVFNSKVEIKIQDVLKKITSFNKRFSFRSSERYIEYQVFRI